MQPRLVSVVGKSGEIPGRDSAASRVSLGMTGRPGMMKRLLKWLLIAAALFWLLVIAGLTAAYFIFDAQDISQYLKKIVEEQTGGKLTIEQTRFSVWKGLNFDGVKFYPPRRGDARGFLYGGEVEERPIAAISHFNLNHDAARIFYGKAHITEIALEDPDIYLENIDGEFNFAEILKYRAQHFPADATETPSEPEAPAQPFALDKLVPIPPALLFLPFALEVSFVGLKNLKFEMRDYAAADLKKELRSVLYLRGLDAGVGLKWVANRNRLWLEVKGHEKNRFDFSQETYAGAAVKKTSADLLQLEGLLHTKLEVRNLNEIKLRLDAGAERLSSGALVLEDLNTSIGLDLAFLPQYQGVTIKPLKVEAVGGLQYVLNGDVLFPKNNFDLFRLKLDQNLTINLQRLESLINQFIPNSKLNGTLKLERLAIEGDVEPAKLSAENLALPHINGILTALGLEAKLPTLGVELSPVSGKLSVAAGPAMQGSGSQLDSAFDFAFDRVSYRKSEGDQNVALQIQNFATKMTARFLYPKIEVPIFKLSAHADHVAASGANIEGIDVPFDFDVDADFQKATARGGLRSRLYLPELLQATVTANCRSSCEDFNSEAAVDIFSFDKVLQLARPILLKMMTLDELPSETKGSFSARLSARGSIPDLTTAKPQTILQNGKVNFNLQTQLNDFTLVRYPVELRNFNNRLSFEGDLKAQKINLKQDFEKLVLALAVEPGEKPKKASVENYRFETLVNTTFLKGINLNNPAADLKASLETKLNLGAVDISDIAPASFSGLQFELRANQNKLKTVNLEKLVLDIPDFGLSVAANGKSVLDDGFQPRNYTASAQLTVDQKDGTTLPTGVKSSGSIDIDLRSSSKDMKTLFIEGGATFDRFFLSVPGTEKDKDLLVLEDMNGKIPLKQWLDWPELQKHLQAKKKNSDTDQKTKKQSFDQVAADYFERTKDRLAENTNRIAIVDYGNVRPFFPGKHPVSIKKLKAANFNFENFEFDLELKQNWLALNQFSVEFLGGKVQGNLQFAFNPTPLALQTTIHMTRLNTRKLLDDYPKLKRKARGWSLLSNPYLDGSIQLKYDLRSRDLDGGLEITSIGEEQLKMILFYVDPKEDNPTVSQIRTALNFGELSHLSVPIKNGFVGLDVDIRVLKVPIPLPNIRGFPIAQLIDNIKEQSDAPEELDENLETPEKEEVIDASAAR